MNDAASGAGEALPIDDELSIPLEQIMFSAVRAQGAGGQHVNKTSSAIHLRFDIAASSLPEDCKARLLARRDQRLSADGVIVIKAQQFRSQEQNRADALQRLSEIVRSAAKAPVTRRPTRVSRSAKRKRVDAKTRRGRVKTLRGPVGDA